MRRDIRNFVRACQICQCAKTSQLHPKPCKNITATVNTEDVNMGQTLSRPTVNPKPCTSYANLFTARLSRKAMNFRTLFTPGGNGVDVVVSVESIRAIRARFANTVYGFFLGKRVAYQLLLIMLETLGVECPKNPGLGAGASETKNPKKNSQAPKSFLVGLKMAFKSNQEYRPVTKKHTANSSSNKKKGVDSTSKVKDNKEKDKIKTKPDKIKSKREAWKSPDSSPTKSKSRKHQ
nr:RNA-directed DNA polymerase, eukaryota, reverse transcriptase zinc-binding domain protein [Tanacetum cinerariifolium]